MVGDIVIFANGTTSTVSAFTSATNVTLSSSVNEASGTHYRFHHVGFQVTNGGNVGIGTTSPQYALDIGNGGNINISGENIYLNGVQRISDSTSSGYTNFRPQNGYLTLYDGTNNESLQVYGSNGSDNVVLQQGSGTYAALYSDTSLVLQQGGGNVGVGTANPGNTLEVDGPNTGQIRVFNTKDTSGNYWNIGEDSSTSDSLVLYDAGNIGQYMKYGTTSWAANSDERLKTNIQSLTPDQGLQAIMQLNPVTYNWKDVNATQETQWGFIAQQVQNVFPDFVENGPTTTIQLADGSTQTIVDPYGLTYTSFIIPTIKAVQQLDTMLSNQQAEINTLQANTSFTSLNVSGSATLASLAVTGEATFQGNITVNGHIVTGGSAPTATALAAAGTDDQGNVNATCSVSGDATSGTITITTGTHVAPGAACEITFSQPFASEPRTVVSQVFPDQSTDDPLISTQLSTGTSAMTLGLAEVALPDHAYTFNYVNLQ